MQNNTKKAFFTRIKNRFQRVYGTSTGTKVMLKQIKEGKLPYYFMDFYQELRKNPSAHVNARNSFRNNQSLKNMVYKKYDFKCAECFDNYFLEIHHIVPLKIDPSLALVLSNLILLCRKCHRKKKHA